ncbi:hypothetical protein AGDE_08830 [Angomonas deanei]|nr:hypothetical protein AGDE_08830 [Angomonas deanei]|eukprot:EPY32166.1 hypothetical protein AGDE_08830 [Angomonas deanei]
MQAELERLAGLVEETISAEEQLEEGRAILTEKKKHLIELKEEHRKLDRNVRTKDKVLEKKPTGATEEEIVRSANYDRQVALYEKSKEEDQIKLNELAVRHRAMEISKAEKRLEMIGDAVTGDGLDEEERVDVELVDELIEEIKGLYNLEIEARAKIDQVDAEVERIEYRVSALELTTDSTRKEMAKIEKDHKRYMKKIKEELNSEQQVNDRDISKLEKELETLRSEVSESRSRRRSVQSSKRQSVR